MAFGDVSKFNFREVHSDTIKEYIKKLNASKKASGPIPISILKLSVDECHTYITTYVNNCIKNNDFPNELKHADITPCHKKNSETEKSNYRPISILPSVSKVFERVLFDQMEAFFKDKFSMYLCGFRKGYSTQYALTHLLYKWQKCLDKSGIVGTLLMDLSKAYDCLPHDLIIAKLEAYGFDKNSLKLILSYLTNRKQRVKNGSFFSTWLDILLGVPQGSILGPILFNIFINDLFMFLKETDICNFADDNTIFACDNDIKNVIARLKADISRVIEWYNTNSMVANPDKFQLMFLGQKVKTQIDITVDNVNINSVDSVKLLGVVIDNKLNFVEHIKNICKMANTKTNALLRIRKYIDTSTAKVLCKCICTFSVFLLPNNMDVL